MKKERLLELAGIESLDESSTSFSTIQRTELSKLIDNALEQLNKNDGDDDHWFWIGILKKLGNEKLANKWRKTLEFQD